MLAFRWNREAQQHQCDERDRENDRALNPLAAPEQRHECGVEEHLVVQRPAELEQRPPVSRGLRIGRGDEEQRQREVLHVRRRGLEQGRRHQRDREYQQRADPVERHDAHDAPEREGAGRERPLARHVRHHEAADDEKDLDAEAPRQQQRVGIAARRMLEDVGNDHQARGKATQSLDRIEGLLQSAPRAHFGRRCADPLCGCLQIPCGPNPARFRWFPQPHVPARRPVVAALLYRARNAVFPGAGAR